MGGAILEEVFALANGRPLGLRSLTLCAPTKDKEYRQYVILRNQEDLLRKYDKLIQTTQHLVQLKLIEFCDDEFLFQVS